MTTLPKSQQRREELVLQVGNIRSDIEAMRVQADMIDREIAGLDFAIAEAKEATPVAKVRAERRNLAEAVLQFFIVNSLESATVDAIAKGIKCKPGETSGILTRLSRASKVELVAGTSDRYRLPIAVEQKAAAE